MTCSARADRKQRPLVMALELGRPPQSAALQVKSATNDRLSADKQSAEAKAKPAAVRGRCLSSDQRGWTTRYGASHTTLWLLTRALTPPQERRATCPSLKGFR